MIGTGWGIAFRLGWRNLWRNTKRTLITSSAIAFAFGLLIGLIGLMEGLKDQLLRNGTLLELGHLQLHDQAYLPDRNIHDTIGSVSGIDVGAFLTRLQSSSQILVAAPRVHAYGLLSTGEYSAGAQLLGIDPLAESRVTTLLDGMQGSSLSDKRAKQVILGRTLAREIHASLRDEVAVVTQGADGTLGNDLFVVTGIVSTGVRHLDRSIAIFHLRDLQELLALEPERIHEVVGLTQDALDADAACVDLNQSHVLPEDAVAQSWGELAPQLKDYVSLTEGMNGFMIVLVGTFAAFGVLNTMMMAVFERTREIGMLGSLGMRPAQILAFVVTESFFLALLGVAAGLGIGALIMSHLTTQGWDLSRWIGEMSMMNTRMDPLLMGVWNWPHVFDAGAGLVLATVVAGLIPGRRIAWKDPVEALGAPMEG